jgi:hypothetical protein
MKTHLGILAAAAFLAVSGSAFAVEEGRRPNAGPPAVGYACVSEPKTGETAVIDGAPPAGFQCPPGQKLFLITGQMKEQVAAMQPPPDPTPPPGLIAPPQKPTPKKTQKKDPCVPTYGALFCCPPKGKCYLK